MSSMKKYYCTLSDETSTNATHFEILASYVERRCILASFFSVKCWVVPTKGLLLLLLLDSAGVKLGTAGVRAVLLSVVVFANVIVPPPAAAANPLVGMVKPTNGFELPGVVCVGWH